MSVVGLVDFDGSIGSSIGQQEVRAGEQKRLLLRTDLDYCCPCFLAAGGYRGRFVDLLRWSTRIFLLDFRQVQPIAFGFIDRWSA